MRALAAVALLLTSGCLLELDKTISCGDGYIDRAVGEECEPQTESSFRDACRIQLEINRPGACSDRCEIDLSVCFPACGNGVLDGAEECDPGEPDPDPDSGSADPSSSGDPPEDDQQIGAELSCTLFDPLDGGGPYAGGTVRTCQADCTWDRTPCHRCGDGQIRGDEVCDTALPDQINADDYCLLTCVKPEEDVRPEVVRCAARCADDCLGYTSDPVDPGCCIPTGQPTHPSIDCCGFEENGACVAGLGGG